MSLKLPKGAGVALGLGLLGLIVTAGYVYAQTAAPAAAPAAPPAPVPNKGDTAWMLVSTALVLMMSVPGLALFYGGLVRSKNMLSVLSQVFMIVALVSIMWVIYGYSMAFTTGPDGLIGAFVGGTDRVFLKGLTPDSTAATFSNGVVIPEIRLHGVPDDLRLYHAGPHRRIVRGTDEVLLADRVHRAVDDLRLLPDRSRGLVLAGSGRRR